MKKIGKPLLSWSLALTMLFVTAIRCSNDDDSTPAPTQSIVAIAQGNTSLSTLVTALTKFPDLVTALSGPGTYTVFAPTNTAFQNLLTAIGQTSLDNVPEDVLESILQYHVVATAALQSNQLTAGNVNTLANENITVTLNPLKLDGTTNVTTPDVLATNGVVHIVDQVLVNPSIDPIVGTVVAPAYFNKSYSILTAAVVRAELVTTLIDRTRQYTVFAPNNNAFITYLNVANEETAITTINGLDETAVADILLFHVLGSEVKSPAIVTGPVTTLRSENNTAFTTKTGNAVTINNARVTTADLEASNGVVHLIDAVLTPPVGDIVDVATSTALADRFEILVASVTKAGLESVLRGDGPLTVFAPTDDAFLTLLRSAAFFNNADLSEAAVLDYINNTISNDSSLPLTLTTLTEVLTYHVVSGSAYSINLTNGQVLPTVKSAAPNTITVGISGSAVTIDGLGSTPSNVGPANISAINGVVHQIDRVMLFE